MIENIIIFTSGFICGLALWIKTGIQTWLSELQMNRLVKKLEKTRSQIEIDDSVDEFLDTKWIPLFIDNFLDRIKNDKMEIKNLEDIEEILIAFRHQALKKREELINKKEK